MDFIHPKTGCAAFGESRGRENSLDPPVSDEAFALLIAAQQEVSQAPPLLEARLAIVTKYAQRIGGGTGATVELRDGDEMVYHAVCGSLAAFDGIRLRLHGSLSGRCVLEARTLYCADSETDERVDRAACRRVGARSMAVIPLLHNGAVIGVLKVVAEQPLAFSETDIAALQVMSSVIIAAMSGVAETEAKSALSTAEDRLRQTAREAEEIGNAMPQIVWAARPDGYVDWYNERWYEFTGFPRGAGDDSDWKQILHPDDAHAFYRDWHHAVQTGEPFQMELRFLDIRSGRYRWHLCRALPIYDAQGQIRKWAGTCTDIDELKQERAARRETEAWMNALLENSPAVIFIRDLVGRYLLVNCQFERASGMYRDAIMGKTDAELFSKEAADGVRARDLTVQQTNAPLISEESSVVNGQTRTYFVVKFPLHDADGKIYAIGGISTDISDRKRAQDEIEALNKRLRRAMAETHHRVKNNLQIIAAMVDMQSMDPECSLGVSDLQRLSRQIRTLATVHDVLTQEAKADGLADEVSTTAILSKLLAMLRQTAPRRPLHTQIANIRLSARQGNSLALLVNELLANAIKYGKHESGVWFGAEGESARLEVSDDGPGFPSDFDPNRAANTGLELVENMARWDLGGETRYETRPEGGGRVVVTFPLRERPYKESQF